jgi:PPM family protein phosphatase
MNKPPPAFSAALTCAALTDVGMRRANNQDSHAIVLAEDEAAWQQRGHLFVVADGMGAHAAGELASRLAVESIPHLYHHYRELSAPEALERAMAETNAEIHRRGEANPDFHNMGTTASVLVLLPQGAVVGHVGDSRAYRMRGDCLEQLSFDHSLQWELRAAGSVAGGSDAAIRVPKNVITRSLGPNPSVAIDLEGPFPLEVGDAFLLCSDGLSGQVTDEEIGPILAHLPPPEAARVLVDLANLRGGPDNITVVVAKVAGEALATNPSHDASIRIGDTPDNRFPPLPAWIAMGVCLFLAAVMGAARQPVVAAIAVAAGLIAGGLGGVMTVLNRRTHGQAVGGNHRLGKGPHVRVVSKADGRFVETLAGILRELRQAAREGGWELQWSEFDKQQRSAEQVTRQGEYPAAVRCYANAISFLMNELRRQRSGEANDSAIEY